VANGILLCWFHHDMVHRRGLRIARGAQTAGGAAGAAESAGALRAEAWRFSRPDGTDLAGPASAPTLRPAPGDAGPPGHEQELLLTG